MDRLDRAVDRELRRFGPAGDAPGMAEIVRVWPAAVGDTVCRNAWPARLSRDGTLHVATSSSTWAFELGRLAGEILGQLRAALGEGAPAALKFAPGLLPEPSAGPAGSGRELRSFGSQGEQRIAVLSLLLAEAELITERRGAPPLLLLDDVLSELDATRRRALADRISRAGQTVLTATGADALPLEPAQLLRVTPGEVRAA